MSEGEDDIYQVESILDSDLIDGELHYLIKWVGYDDPKDYTWEPIAHLPNCAQLIMDYWQKHRDIKYSSKKDPDPVKEEVTGFWDAQQYPFITFKALADDPLGPKFEELGPFGCSQCPPIDCFIKSLELSSDGIRLIDSKEQTATISVEAGIKLFPDVILDGYEDS